MSRASRTAWVTLLENTRWRSWIVAKRVAALVALGFEDHRPYSECTENGGGYLCGPSVRTHRSDSVLELVLFFMGS